LDDKLPGAIALIMHRLHERLPSGAASADSARLRAALSGR